MLACRESCTSLVSILVAVIKHGWVLTDPFLGSGVWVLVRAAPTAGPYKGRGDKPYAIIELHSRSMMPCTSV